MVQYGEDESELLPIVDGENQHGHYCRPCNVRWSHDNDNGGTLATAQALASLAAAEAIRSHRSGIDAYNEVMITHKREQWARHQCPECKGFIFAKDTRFNRSLGESPAYPEPPTALEAAIEEELRDSSERNGADE